MPVPLNLADPLGSRFRLVVAGCSLIAVCRYRMDSNQLREVEIGYVYLSVQVFRVIAIDHKNGQSLLIYHAAGCGCPGQNWNIRNRMKPVKR
jgi:hypothetical protein